MATDREKQLETILQMMAQGLRSKARNLDNPVTAHYTDPKACLLAAAAELEAAAGGKLVVNEQGASGEFYPDELELIIGDQATVYGGPTPVAKVKVDIEQETVALELEPNGIFAKTPKLLRLRVTIQPKPTTTSTQVRIEPKPRPKLH